LEAEKRRIFFKVHGVRNEINSATAKASNAAKAVSGQESAVLDIQYTYNISQAVTNNSYLPYRTMTPALVQANLKLLTLAQWQKCGIAKCEFMVR
jgi:hypothetical protein